MSPRQWPSLTRAVRDTPDDVALGVTPPEPYRPLELGEVFASVSTEAS